MKVKLMSAVAVILMFALAAVPIAAEACSGNKTNPNSGTSSPTNTQEGIRQS